MNRASKRAVRFAAFTAVVATLVVQPALAAAKTPERGSNFESLIRKIVRALDTIGISLPPG